MRRCHLDLAGAGSSRNSFKSSLCLCMRGTNGSAEIHVGAVGGVWLVSRRLLSMVEFLSILLHRKIGLVGAIIVGGRRGRVVLFVVALHDCERLCFDSQRQKTREVSNWATDSVGGEGMYGDKLTPAWKSERKDSDTSECVTKSEPESKRVV